MGRDYLGSGRERMREKRKGEKEKGGREEEREKYNTILAHYVMV